MSKYKTLDQSSTQAKLAETIQKRLKTNRLLNPPWRDNQVSLTPMSENKSIIFIKLPKRSQKQANSFKASLYQSSLKRLKQQRVTLIKDTAIPTIKPKMNYESFQEEAIRKALQQSTASKKQNFPHLHRLIGDTSRKHYSFIQRSQQRINQNPQLTMYQQINPKSDIPHRKSVFEVDSQALGFANLKQKYLQLRQFTLRDQKKSQLLEKPQYRRYQPQKSLEEYESRFKMEKSILDHMNRYNHNQFFQTKINGFKTRIYPHEKGQYRHREEAKKSKKKQVDCQRKQEHVENFIRKKRKSFYPQTTISQYPQSSLAVQQNKRESVGRMTIRGRGQIQPFEKVNECTPWQTDAQF